MTKVVTAGALLATLLLSGCFEGTNQACASDCFSMNIKEGTDPAQVDADIKRACERMGKTTPEVLQRTPTLVAGRCT